MATRSRTSPEGRLHSHNVHHKSHLKSLIKLILVWKYIGYKEQNKPRRKIASHNVHHKRSWKEIVLNEIIWKVKSS